MTDEYDERDYDSGPDGSVWDQIDTLKDERDAAITEAAGLRAALADALTIAVGLRAQIAEREEVRDKRSIEWSKMVRSIFMSSMDNLDERDDVAEMRECLVRTRLGASAERQCAETNSAVCDLYGITMPDGTKAHRFVFSTPTGDLGELREVARSIAAAFYLGAKDAKDVREWMALAEAAEIPQP